MAGVLKDGSLARALFKMDHAFRPVLRELALDPAFQTEGDSPAGDSRFTRKDLQWLTEEMPTPTKKMLDDLWADDVAAAILEPLTERQWSFLKKCASGDYDTDNVGDVAASAIETLKLIASLRSQRILEELRPMDEALASFISEAIRYVKSRPEPLSDRNLVDLGKRVALAVKFDTEWKRNTPPEFNKSPDKALIDLDFADELQKTTHTATFQKVNELWKFRGMHMSRATFSPGPACEPVLRPVSRDNR